MSFFDDRPERPKPQPPGPQAPWIAAPGNELGASVPTRIVLARTETLAIAVLDVVAFTTGFQMRVAFRGHPAGERLDPRELFAGVRPSGDVAEGGFRFGIEFADGRKVTSLDPRPHGSREEPPAISLAGGGGGGGGNSGYEARYWVYPLPPRGPLTLAVEWQARGIDLTLHQVDAAPIIAAASRSEALWEPGPGGGGSGTSWGSITLRRSGEPPAEPRPSAGP